MSETADNPEDATASAKPPRPPKKHREVAASADKLAGELGLTELPQMRSKRWIMRIGALLRGARCAANLAQDDVAARAEIMQPYLSRLENGLPESTKVVRGPGADVLLRCADALGCDIEITLRSRQTRQALSSVSSAEISGLQAVESVAPAADSSSEREIERLADVATSNVRLTYCTVVKELGDLPKDVKGAGVALVEADIVKKLSPARASARNVRENQYFDAALRRFKLACEKAGILPELRRRGFDTKPDAPRGKLSKSGSKSVQPGRAKKVSARVQDKPRRHDQ